MRVSGIEPFSNGSSDDFLNADGSPLEVLGFCMLSPIALRSDYFKSRIPRSVATLDWLHGDDFAVGSRMQVIRMLNSATKFLLCGLH